MLEEMSHVSIIMPTYNRSYILSPVIASILNQSYSRFELIILDDCSDDNTESVISSFSDYRIQYHKLDRHVGSSEARNIGLNLSNAELVLMTDDDMPMRQDYLQVLLDAFLDKEGRSALFGRIISIESTGEFGTDFQKAGEPVYVSKITGEIKNNWGVSSPTSTELPVGHGCILFLKKWWEGVGGYAHFPVNGYREESDFCLRLRRIGVSLEFIPEAVIYHIQNTEGGQRTSSFRYLFWVYANHLKYLGRNFGLRIPYMLLMYTLKFTIDNLTSLLRKVSRPS